jgi:hypothetical protein
MGSTNSFFCASEASEPGQPRDVLCAHCRCALATYRGRHEIGTAGHLAPLLIRLRYVDLQDQAALLAELRDEEQWLRDLFPYGAAIGTQWLEFVSCETCLTEAARLHFGPANHKPHGWKEDIKFKPAYEALRGRQIAN